MNEVVTVFSTFTRRWAIDRWIENMVAQDYDKSLINLVFIIDVDEPEISIKLTRMHEEHGYRSLKIIMNKENNPNEVRINVRRERIAFTKQQSKVPIMATDGDYVIGLEDDTVFPPDTFTKLMTSILADKKIAFVEGVQCGRWGVKMIGAWRANDFHNPTYIETLMPSENLQEIDGGGFYGYVTKKNCYLGHDYGWTDEPWGADVNYGLWLKRLGFSCYIDWSLVFLHNDFNNLLDPLTNVSQICYTKDTNSNTWSRHDVDRISS